VSGGGDRHALFYNDCVTILFVAYDREAILLRIIGHFGSSATNFADYWSTGLRLAVVGGTSPSTGGLVTFLETISGPVQTFHQLAGAYVGNNCYIDELTAAHIGLDGKYASDFTETVRRPYTTPPPGGGTPTQPWNTAQVTGLRTLKKRGGASNGRMSYPALAATVTSTTGRVSQSTVQTRLTAMKTMYDAINAAAQTASSGLRIHVMSKVNNGWSAMVTDIRADGRLDSIERRENDQPVTYATAILA